MLYNDVEVAQMVKNLPSMQEIWVVFPSSGDLSDSGIQPRSPALKADS